MSTPGADDDVTIKRKHGGHAAATSETRNNKWVEQWEQQNIRLTDWCQQNQYWIGNIANFVNYVAYGGEEPNPKGDGFNK